MSDNTEEPTAEQSAFFTLADQFINLANDLSKDGSSSDVGTAMRYAAARYNTFEASLSTNDLAAEEGKMTDMLTDDFREMLKVHMKDYIGIVNRNK